MEYLLLGVLLLGIVLFVLGWLVMAGICFQRHPVTGLVALIPGLNLLTLPAMWHRVSGWVITSVIGALLASVVWFAGANQHVYHYAQLLGLNVAPAATAVPGAASPQVVSQTIDIPPAARATSAAPTSAVSTPQPPAPAQPKVPTPAELLAGAKELPASALYHVVFKNIDVSKLADNEEQYVRIIQTDGHKREGKLISASGSEISLEERLAGGAITRTIKTADIREAAVMTHEKGQETP